MNHEADSEPMGAGAVRRYLTLLFADLSHSTELSEHMHAEDYAVLVAELRAICQDAIPRHGGMVVRQQGDGVLALFGYPAGREDTGRQAVHAALELHERVRSLAQPLPRGLKPSLHSGIHSGLVLLRKGDLELGRYELFGAVPNTAARLSSAAGPHEILVSEETLGPASRFFEMGPLTPLKVRGRTEPLPVFKVDARASAARNVGSGHFFGRQAEMARLVEALDAALRGGTRSVAVQGPPGVGKTRLVEQFLARGLQRGCTVLLGYCESTLGAEPMQPFRHMLQSLGTEQLPATPEGLAAPFLALARERPLLLFVDDWQWADDASHAVLSLLRTGAGGKLMVVLSARDGEAAVSLSADEVIPLQPLTPAEAQELVAARFPGGQPFAWKEICEAGSGNPLFLEELCHSAARGEPEHGGRMHAAWLSQLVQSRVQGLEPARAELVRVAAVIGNVAPVWLLELLTGQAVDGPMLRDLAQRDFVFPGERAETLRFKHGITRDIVYESVGLHARQQLHLRIAATLKEHNPGDAEALALHYDAGGDAVNAAHYAEAAGDKALSVSALDRARVQYTGALAALDRLEQTREVALRWVHIVQKLGRVCVFDPVRNEIVLALRAMELAQRHGDARTVARMRHWLGYMSYAIGDARAAIRHGGQALAEARAAGDHGLVGHAVAALGESLCAAADYERALPLLDQAIAVKRQHRSEGRAHVQLAFSLVCRAWLLAERGAFAEAHVCFEEAASVSGGMHEVGATVHGWRSAVLLWQGRWEEARASATLSGHIAETTHSLAQLAIARAMAAYAEWMLLRRPESIEAILRVMEWLKPREGRLYRSLYHGWLADGLADLGRPEEAREHVAQALLRARQRDLLGLPMAWRALARDAVLHAPERANHYLRRAMAASRRRNSAHEIAVTQLCGAEIAWGQGQAAQARSLADTAADAFAGMDMDWHLGRAEALRRLTDSQAAPRSA